MHTHLTESSTWTNEVGGKDQMCHGTAPGVLGYTITGVMLMMNARVWVEMECGVMMGNNGPWRSNVSWREKGLTAD